MSLQVRLEKSNRLHASRGRLLRSMSFSSCFFATSCSSQPELYPKDPKAWLCSYLACGITKASNSWARLCIILWAICQRSSRVWMLWELKSLALGAEDDRLPTNANNFYLPANLQTYTEASSTPSQWGVFQSLPEKVSHFQWENDPQWVNTMSQECREMLLAGLPYSICVFQDERQGVPWVESCRFWEWASVRHSLVNQFAIMETWIRSAAAGLPTYLTQCLDTWDLWRHGSADASAGRKRTSRCSETNLCVKWCEEGFGIEEASRL